MATTENVAVERLPATASGSGRSGRSVPAWWRDTAALIWLLGVGLLVLLPALLHGGLLGPFDLLSQGGLTQQSGTTAHNPYVQDQISQMIPWTKLAWTQVHHGQLPLWNPYSGLGMPLAFNWQSSAFSLPALVGYLVPLHSAFTVQLFVTLVIAGSGVYVLGRVMRWSIWACVFAATVFELSGPLLAWLGWPVSSVVAWAGWLFAAVLVVFRGSHRSWSIAFLAVVLAASIYAGQVDILAVMIATLVVFVVVLLALRTHWLRGSGPILRPAVDLVVGSVAGCALAAPLLLPGLQLIAGSVRASGAHEGPLGVTNVLNLGFQGYDGLPLAGQAWFGRVIPFYPDYSIYVGVAVVVLAVAGVAMRRRRPEVKALAVMGVVAFALTFSGAAISIVQVLPMSSTVHWHRAFVMLVFTLALLAGAAIDVLVRSPSRSKFLRWSGYGFGAMVLILLALWLFGRGGLTEADLNVRNHSFVWPALQCLVGLLVVGLLAAAQRLPAPATRPGRLLLVNRGRLAAAVLLVCESAFLLTSGAPLISSSSQYFAPTPAVTQLRSIVGDSVVAVGGGVCPGYGNPPQTGFIVETNDAYEVQELAIYDPILPKSYDRSWLDATGKHYSNGSALSGSVFCPIIDSVKLARLYGVPYVLVPRGSEGPHGSQFVAHVGDQALYRIPGAAAATVSPMDPSGLYPPAYAPGSPVTVSHADPASWKMTTDSATTQALRIRLTDVPGWHATIDGKPLPLTSFEGVMLEARIPPGRHVVELHYWPTTFTIGIALMVLAIVMLVALVVAEHFRPGVLRGDFRTRRS